MRDLLQTLQSATRKKLDEKILEMIDLPIGTIDINIKNYIEIAKQNGFSSELFLFKEILLELALAQINIFSEEKKERNELEMAFEKYLILNNNLEKIEKGLKFISEQITIRSGIIDILAQDANNYEVIVELKISPSDANRAEYQIMKYHGATKKRVIFVSPKIKPELYFALIDKIEDNKVSLYEYKQIQDEFVFTKIDESKFPEIKRKPVIYEKQERITGDFVRVIARKIRNHIPKPIRKKKDSKTNSPREIFIKRSWLEIPSYQSYLDNNGQDLTEHCVNRNIKRHFDVLVCPTTLQEKINEQQSFEINLAEEFDQINNATAKKPKNLKVDYSAIIDEINHKLRIRSARVLTAIKKYFSNQELKIIDAYLESMDYNSDIERVKQDFFLWQFAGAAEFPSIADQDLEKKLQILRNEQNKYQKAIYRVMNNNLRQKAKRIFQSKATIMENNPASIELLNDMASITLIPYSELINEFILTKIKRVEQLQNIDIELAKVYMDFSPLAHVIISERMERFKKLISSKQLTENESICYITKEEYDGCYNIFNDQSQQAEIFMKWAGPKKFCEVIKMDSELFKSIVEKYIIPKKDIESHPDSQKNNEPYDEQKNQDEYSLHLKYDLLKIAILMNSADSILTENMLSTVNYFLDQVRQKTPSAEFLDEITKSFNKFKLAVHLRNGGKSLNEPEFANFFSNINNLYVQLGVIPTKKDLEKLYERKV